MKMHTFYLGIFLASSCIIAQVNDENNSKEVIPSEKKFHIGQGLTIEPNEWSANKSFVVKRTSIGLDSEVREKIINSLRTLLADNYVLYTKALNFHWNVEGELFSQLHEFFKNLYESLQESNDLLAERIRALGGYSPGSLQQFLVLTQLKEDKGGKLNYLEMLRILLADFETIIRAVRSATELTAENNDWGTNNMLAGMLEGLEKQAWMIRAHLQK